MFTKSDIQKYRKELARDVNEIYHAGTLEGAEVALLRLGEKWNEKFPAIYALWECNCKNIITIFTYPAEIRRVIYPTNAIEALNGVIRSRVKTKRILGRDESALASKKWTLVRYADRFPKVA